MRPRGPLVFLTVALIALLPCLILVALPFLTSFILASILAVVMNPVKEWLVLRIHRAGLATFLTTFATVLVVGIVVAFAGFTIARELTAAYDGLSRRSLEEGGWPTLVTHTTDRVVDALATRRLRLTPSQCRTKTLRRNGSVARLRGRMPGNRCQKYRPHSRQSHFPVSSCSTVGRNPQLSWRKCRTRRSFSRKRTPPQRGQDIGPACRADILNFPASCAMPVIW
jgi:hypothetical protein